MKRFVTGTIRYCHLCGLTIPSNIVSASHPLFGTVDHVVPLSIGGSSSVRNRRAAHRLCNQRKGCLTEIDSPFRMQLQVDVAAIMRRKPEWKALSKGKEIVSANHRIGISEFVAREQYFNKKTRLDEWENEGGAVWPVGVVFGTVCVECVS